MVHVIQEIIIIHFPQDFLRKQTEEKNHPIKEFRSEVSEQFDE